MLCHVSENAQSQVDDHANSGQQVDPLISAVSAVFKGALACCNPLYITHGCHYLPSIWPVFHWFPNFKAASGFHWFTVSNVSVTIQPTVAGPDSCEHKVFFSIFYYLLVDSREILLSNAGNCPWMDQSYTMDFCQGHIDRTKWRIGQTQPVCTCTDSVTAITITVFSVGNHQICWVTVSESVPGEKK